MESEASAGVGNAEWVTLEGPKRSHVSLKKKMLSLKTVNMEPIRAQGTKRHVLQQLKWKVTCISLPKLRNSDR